MATEALNHCPRGSYKTSEQFNSFVLVPKASGKVRVCLDPVQLNKALITPTHSGLMPNDILLRLAGVKYLMLTDASSVSHNLKCNEKSSYLWYFLVHLTGIGI